MKKIKLSFGRVLTFLIILSYSLTLALRSNLIVSALKSSWEICWSIVPLLILAFVFMVIVDYFLSPAWLKRQLGQEAGVKKWIIAIGAGIAAVGPGFVWYPMLQDLRRQGITDDILVAFLYCKAINVQFFPMIVYYFGLKYLIVITTLMIFASVLQGLLFRIKLKQFRLLPQ